MTAPRQPQTISLTRRYKASIEAAFDAWTEPTALEQWFGPPGYQARVLTHNLRIGGTWRFSMDNGRRNPFHHFGTFIEISPG